METDLSSKLPLKQHFKNIRKVLGFVQEIDRNYFRFLCPLQLLNVSIPYIELLLSAHILNIIGSGKSFKEMMTTVVAAVLGILLLHFITSTANNRMEVRRGVIAAIYNNSVESRMLHMDFSRLNSPELKMLQDRIRNDNSWGAGINSVLWTGGTILSYLWDILFAVVLGAPVVMYLIRSKSVVGWLVLAVVFILSGAVLCLRSHYRKLNAAYRYRIDCSTPEEKEELTNFSWRFGAGMSFDYKNGKDIRIYGSYDLMERWTTEVFTHKRFRDMLTKSVRTDAGNAFLTSSLTGMINGASYLIVVVIALAGEITIGNVVRFAGCLSRLLGSLKDLVDILSEFSLSARRQLSTLALIELEDEMYKGKLPMEKRSDNEYQIEFKNVSFQYPGTETYALKNFSMKLKIGEKLAIVGMNSSGKTTMIKLLCRLYDPQEGEITLNGVDIRKFKHEEYSRLFSVVFQDYKLFAFPLGQNVAVNQNYTPEQVIKSLEEAGFGARLSRMEQGLDTYLYKNYDDSGLEISGGEEQKIAIARAIYKNAPFILLDEPTAALDPKAEYEIYTNFDHIVGDKTAIYISHRLSSCRFCEKIAVFHEGRLVQTGSHEELLAQRDGKYYEMWNAQAQYYADSGIAVIE